MRSVTTVRNGMPMASHACGNIEIEVQPGSVLISLTSTSPSAVTKVSTRLSPMPSTASNARTAVSRTRAIRSSPIFAGISVWLAWESMYLLSKT